MIGLVPVVKIQRENGMVETLEFATFLDMAGTYTSHNAPAEPHEFRASIELTLNGSAENVSFEMHEPTHDHAANDHSHGHSHSHSHDDMDDDEHARAHAADLPSYVGTATRPTAWQIIAFGAAGGMIPCPASITVMLLALSIGQVGLGMFTVLGFSLGLAVTLVGIGMLVVTGISRLEFTSKFSWFPRHAPVISAAMVIVSGLAALLLTH